MKNTNCENNCAFVKAGFCETDTQCPNYVQSLWQEQGNPTPVIVSDCFPKKFALEQNLLLHRFLAMQSVLEQNRNELNDLKTLVSQLCSVLCKKDEMKEFKNLTDNSNRIFIE